MCFSIQRMIIVARVVISCSLGRNSCEITALHYKVIKSFSKQDSGSKQQNGIRVRARLILSITFDGVCFDHIRSEATSFGRYLCEIILMLCSGQNIAELHPCQPYIIRNVRESFEERDINKRGRSCLLMIRYIICALICRSYTEERGGKSTKRHISTDPRYPTQGFKKG